MRDATPAARAEQVFLIVAGLSLPSLSLLVMGGLYLWEKSLLLWWALGSLAVVCVIVLWQRWWLHRAVAAEPTTASNDVGSAGDAFSQWTPQEREAWADVRAIARSTEFDQLTSPDGLVNVATATIEAVARRLHAGSNDAVWQFTLPEALAISERVSRRLGHFVVTHIPFGERLTVSQILTLYRARQIADMAGKAYDLWRLIRLVNPATALTHEARERLTKALYNWGRAQVTRRLVDAYVDEVGRAAIDLYSGRLRQAARPAIGRVETAGGEQSASEQAQPHVVKQTARTIGALVTSLFKNNK